MRKISGFLMILIAMLFAAGCSAKKDLMEESQHYENLIFDPACVHTVEITMSEEDMADLFANPKEKTKYRADAVIDGEEIKDVAVHTKGNSSLYFPADAGRDKFSLGIDFGNYVKGQTFFGLETLDLQNNFTDATLMKEYMAYWLFRRMGIDAPLASYAWVRINGEDQGIFTAAEEIGEDYLDRTKDGKGTIYKPEDSDMALDDEEIERLKAGDNAAHDSGGGADLVYRGDDEKSYPDIFENAKTADDAKTRARLIRSLKAIAEKKDLDQYLDTDEIIKYFAVHNFLVNYDSYTGEMLHNYCLYEKDGRLSMLPWDYDTAFGSFPKDARTDTIISSDEVINTGIDSPLGEIREEARPMWSWILSDERYRNAYHERLKEVTEIISSGEFEKEADRVADLILPFIEKDPKGYYSRQEFEKAMETFLAFSKLRTDSVERQLDGRLAARSEQQKQEERTDASQISIDDMGSLKNLQR